MMMGEASKRKSKVSIGSRGNRKVASLMLPSPRRQLIGSIGAHESWSRTPDRSARTLPARQAFNERFEQAVDPDNQLTPEERAIRAAHLRKAHFQRMALASAKARGRNTTAADDAR